MTVSIQECTISFLQSQDRPIVDGGYLDVKFVRKEKPKSASNLNDPSTQSQGPNNYPSNLKSLVRSLLINQSNFSQIMVHWLTPKKSQLIQPIKLFGPVTESPGGGSCSIMELLLLDDPSDFSSDVESSASDCSPSSSEAFSLLFNANQNNIQNKN
ncbi:hypothetical protein Avbf_12004 [Armadillidium vulgare]|nr:hypothetical protein Avbf_12004 [Armadillidium vulgare]